MIPGTTQMTYLRRKVNGTHIQAATNLGGQASFYLWSQH